MKRVNEEAIEALLKKDGVRYANLSDVPLARIRSVQRGAFPDMRMIDLAPSSCERFQKQPILLDLLCTRIGYQGPSAAHYIPRPVGSVDHILIFCTEGRGWLEIDGEEWPVGRGEAFLVPRGVPHTYGAVLTDPWSNYWIHFRGRQGAVYAEMMAGGESPIFHLHRREEVVFCIEQLYQYMGNVHAYSELVAASGALGHLLGLIQFRKGTTERKGWTAEEGVGRSIDFMRKNIEKSLRLADLARIAGMSSGHYGMLFRNSRCYTPVEYFNRMKIQKACELLKTTDQSVGIIAEELGFQDPYYFSRLFKKVMGLSPRAYR